MKKIGPYSPTSRLEISGKELHPLVRRFIEAIADLCVERDQLETFADDRDPERKQSRSEPKSQSGQIERG